MSIAAATVILAIVSILALLAAAPLIYLLRRARRKARQDQSGLAPQPLSLLQALPGLFIVVALFFAYAAEYIAPQSWLGQRVTTLEGKFWLFLLVWVTLFAVERAIRSLRRRNEDDRGLK
jgi:hypothetical protein